jgi:hypothetical protein
MTWRWQAGMFMCYMVEAARRLNCLDDLET